jgi:hypothetical protein
VQEVLALEPAATEEMQEPVDARAAVALVVGHRWFIMEEQSSLLQLAAAAAVAEEITAMAQAAAAAIRTAA